MLEAANRGRQVNIQVKNGLLIKQMECISIPEAWKARSAHFARYHA
jgi:hypothetical protein